MNEEIINKVIAGDARKLINLIDDESIDFIVCDPVYQELWQYEWLAEIAARVLKPYGNVLAQAGHIHRWEAEQKMQHPDLIKRTLLTEMFSGGFTTVWMHKTLRANIFYIWLEKTGINEQRRWVRTIFWGTRDKNHHRWGDGESGFVYLIQQFTKPGDLVLDPFTGGGTVPAVCKILGRRYIAFELLPYVAKRASQRLDETQAMHPLFLEATEVQLDFFSDEEETNDDQTGL